MQTDSNLETTENYKFYGKQLIITTESAVCRNIDDLLYSKLFIEIIDRFLKTLHQKDSYFLNIFPQNMCERTQAKNFTTVLQLLAKEDNAAVSTNNTDLKFFFHDKYSLHQLVEKLYNFWRNFERFLVCDTTDSNKKTFSANTPYTTFHNALEPICHLVRGVYRDICKNITGANPRVYRQVAAGCQIGLIVGKEDKNLADRYAILKEIPLIKHIMINPPLIIDPPANKREGNFREVHVNPIYNIDIDPKNWLCYPAKVGTLTVYTYFHKKFISLGSALANLFDLAEENELHKKPDAICMFGIDEYSLAEFGHFPTIFHNDKEKDILFGIIPDAHNYGYFGYLKKMILTLHNIKVMQQGRMPVHGAMINVILKNNQSANIIIMGDTGAGKSESIEAFRAIGDKYIKHMTIIFDDMGSLEMAKDGTIRAYGTETGAFVRLDDLRPDFAFGNIDRSIIMSPQKINARALLPITTLTEIQKGYPVNFFLYANNYENITEDKPFLEKFLDVASAMPVFRQGARMAKGTTNETGLVSAYFANVFGPMQFKNLHDVIADKFFKAFFEQGIFVGQLRTRLGIAGFESKGPESAAEALLKTILKKNS